MYAFVLILLIIPILYFWLSTIFIVIEFYDIRSNLNNVTVVNKTSHLFVLHMKPVYCILYELVKLYINICKNIKSSTSKLNLRKEEIVTKTRTSADYYSLTSSLARIKIIPNPICQCNNRSKYINRVIWQCKM